MLPMDKASSKYFPVFMSLEGNTRRLGAEVLTGLRLMRCLLPKSILAWILPHVLLKHVA